MGVWPKTVIFPIFWGLDKLKDFNVIIEEGERGEFTIRYKGNIIFDKSKPNGTPKKVLDISLAKKYGWKPLNKLENSILKTYKSFLKERNDP